MASDVVFKASTREFHKTMLEFSKGTSKVIGDFLNDQARRLALDALDETPKADPAKIRKELKGPAHNVSSIRLGRGASKEAKATEKSNMTLGGRIIAARRRDAGEPPLYGKALTEAVNAMVKGRTKTVGYLKSGWIPAIKKFSQALGIAPRHKKVNQFGKPKGGARPAPRNKPVGQIVKASFLNLAVKDMTKNSAKPGKAFVISQRAMNRAISKRTAKMKAVMQKRMDDLAKKHSAKK